MNPLRLTRAPLLALCLTMALLVIGCAPAGSPSVTFTKDVSVTIANGDTPTDLHGVTVNVTYDQTSSTGIESQLEQQLSDLLNPSVHAPLLP